MKYIFIIIFNLTFIVLSHSQKEDYIWLFGKDQLIEPGLQATQFDFNSNPFEPEVRNGGLSFDRNNTSICDAEGNLLMYSNGCAIANGEHEIMENGDSINYGLFFKELWLDDCANGYPGRQDIIILNDPGNENGFYLIHKTVEFETNSDPSAFWNSLKYSYVDMAANNGAGIVTDKNILFHEERLFGSFLSAIRHSNGRDWWLVQPTEFSSEFLVFLLDENGFELKHRIKNSIDFIPLQSSASGTARFSPDGLQYAFFSNYNGCFLFDFDRSSGILENNKIWIIRPPPSVEFATVEFSPNSRFLYLCHGDTLRQLDTWEDELEDGNILIDTWNGIADPFPGTFFVSALGPDCRIYIRMGSGTNSFHIIHEPDQKGLACNFEQQAIQLPLISASGSFPNHPRFRVDEAEKCDTGIVSIFNEIVYYTRDLEIFPNPVRDWLYMGIPDEYPKGRLLIYDAMGSILVDESDSVFGSPFLNRRFSQDVSEWGSGIYFVEYLPEGHERDRVMYVGKIIKMDN